MRRWLSRAWWQSEMIGILQDQLRVYGGTCYRWYLIFLILYQKISSAYFQRSFWVFLERTGEKWSRNFLLAVAFSLAKNKYMYSFQYITTYRNSAHLSMNFHYGLYSKFKKSETKNTDFGFLYPAELLNLSTRPPWKVNYVLLGNARAFPLFPLDYF